MVDLAEAPPVMSAERSDDAELSAARLKVAAVCLLGVALGTSVLPFCVVDAVRGPMMLELGWDADQLSLSYALMLWAAAIGVWPVGMLIDRFGARPVVTVGAVGVALVSLTMPFVRHFWQTCTLFSLLGLCGSAGLGYSKIVATLFDRRRGLALGIFAAVTSALGWAFPLFADRLVHADGWAGAFRITGLVVLAAAPLLYLGLAPRNCETALYESAMDGAKASQAVRARPFWLIVAASLITILVANLVLDSIKPALVLRGFGDAADLRGSPIGMLAMLAGPICAGVLLDRFRTPLVAVAAYAGSAVTCLMWSVVSPSFGGAPLLTIILALGAFAYSAQFPVVGYFFSRYFGLRAFATIWGLQMFIQSVGLGLAGPRLTGVIDAAVNQPLMYILGTAAPLLAIGLYLLLPPESDGASAKPAGQSLRAFRTWWSRAPS